MFGCCAGRSIIYWHLMSMRGAKVGLARTDSASPKFDFRVNPSGCNLPLEALGAQAARVGRRVGLRANVVSGAGRFACLHGDPARAACACAQGKRYSLANSRIMIHQPLGGAQGQAAGALAVRHVWVF